MLRIRSLLFFLVIFLAGLGSLAAQKVPPQSRQPRLIPGVPVQGVVELGPRRESVDRYRLAIPENAYAVEFEITESSADLDLLLYDDSGELFVYSEEDVFNESFVLTRLGEPALFAGEFELEVAYQWSRPPVVRG